MDAISRRLAIAVGFASAGAIILGIFIRAASFNPAETSKGAVKAPQKGDQEMAMREMRSHILALSENISELRRSSATPQPSGELPQQPAAELNPAPQPLSLDDERAMKQQELQNRIDSEPIDRSWSQATERQIDLSFQSGIAAGTKLDSARCTATVCRVDLSLDGENAKASLAPALARTKPFDYEVYYFTEPDSLRTTLYVLRPPDNTRR